MPQQALRKTLHLSFAKSLPLADVQQKEEAEELTSFYKNSPVYSMSAFQQAHDTD